MYCNNGEGQAIPPLHRGPATCLCSFAMATSAAVARSSTNPSPHPFSWGRAFRIRSTGISVVPCPRGATLGSRSPAAGASRSFGLAQFSGTRNARQFKSRRAWSATSNSTGRERFACWWIVQSCPSGTSAQVNPRRSQRGPPMLGPLRLASRPHLPHPDEHISARPREL